MRYGIYFVDRSCLSRLGCFCFLSFVMELRISAWPPYSEQGREGMDAPGSPGAKHTNSGPNCPKVQLHGGWP